MLVVFGTRVFKKKLGHSRELIHCENCKYSTHWEYLRRRNWLALYYIPLIPLPSKEVFCCPECGFGVQVDQGNQHKILPMINFKE